MPYQKIGKNAESLGENPVLWAISSMSPCGAGLLRSQIRKKHGIEGERAKRSKLFFHYGCGTTPGVQPRTIVRKL